MTTVGPPPVDVRSVQLTTGPLAHGQSAHYQLTAASSSSLSASNTAVIHRGIEAGHGGHKARGTPRVSCTAGETLAVKISNENSIHRVGCDHTLVNSSTDGTEEAGHPKAAAGTHAISRAAGGKPQRFSNPTQKPKVRQTIGKKGLSQNGPVDTNSSNVSEETGTTQVARGACAFEAVDNTADASMTLSSSAMTLATKQGVRPGCYRTAGNPLPVKMLAQNLSRRGSCYRTWEYG